MCEIGSSSTGARYGQDSRPQRHLPELPPRVGPGFPWPAHQLVPHLRPVSPFHPEEVVSVRESLRQLPVGLQFALACLLVVDGLLWVVTLTVYLMGGQ